MSSGETDWWRAFFEDPAVFRLGLFPDAEETEAEVAGIMQMLELERGERVADICCGAGRHLVRLAAAGMRLFGLDRSAMMLRLAVEEVRRWGVDATIVGGDMRHLPFASGAFDAVTNCFNSFGYLADDSENEMALAEMARCLRPAGRLLLDTRNRQFQILFAPYHMETELPDGTPVVVSSRWNAQTRRLTTLWREAEPSGVVRHRATIRLYGMDELDAMMERCGLEKVAVYGTYQGEPFEGFHRQLLYVARRLG